MEGEVYLLIFLLFFRYLFFSYELFFMCRLKFVVFGCKGVYVCLWWCIFMLYEPQQLYYEHSACQWMFFSLLLILQSCGHFYKRLISILLWTFFFVSAKMESCWIVRKSNLSKLAWAVCFIDSEAWYW
jgi:hypothetical protein